MMRRRDSRRSDLPLTADINVTSLVDVAFTLLVIFIITAPVLQGGIELTLPEADVAPIDTPDQPLIVSMQRDGAIFIEDTEYSLEEFRAALPQLVSAGNRETVYFRADTDAPYGRAVQVLGIVNTTGARVSVVAEPWTGPR